MISKIKYRYLLALVIFPILVDVIMASNNVPDHSIYRKSMYILSILAFVVLARKYYLDTIIKSK